MEDLIYKIENKIANFKATQEYLEFVNFYHKYNEFKDAIESADSIEKLTSMRSDIEGMRERVKVFLNSIEFLKEQNVTTLKEMYGIE